MKKLFSYFSVFFIPMILFPQILIDSPDIAVKIALNNSKEYQNKMELAILKMDRTVFDFQSFLPSVSVSFAENDTINLNKGDSRTKNIRVSLSQLVFDGGQALTTYKENKILNSYEYENMKLERRNFISEIISAYYNLIKQKKIIVIKEDLVKNAERQLNIINKQKDLGLIIETDYFNFLISFNKIKNEEKQVKREFEKMKRQFAVSMGLSAETDLIIAESNLNESSLFLLEPFFYDLYILAKKNSVQLKKMQLSLESERNRVKMKNRWYLPTLYFQGNISFSGKKFPLTQPIYSIQLKINFENNPFFPISLSNNYDLNESGLLTSVNNNTNSNIVMNTTYFHDKKIEKINLLQNEILFTKSEQDLYESIFSSVTTHDDYLNEIKFSQETLKIFEMKLEQLKVQLKNGEIKQIDFLDALTEEASEKVSLLDKQVQIEKLRRFIEINTGLELGGLEKGYEK